MERRNFIKKTVGAAGIAFVPEFPEDVDEELREQNDLPSFEDMADEQEIDESKIVLALEGEGWRAIASPDVSDGASSRKFGSPFDFVSVGDPPSNEELGDSFSEQFDQKVNAVYDLIDESDDPLDAILDLEPDDLIVSPDGWEGDE